MILTTADWRFVLPDVRNAAGEPLATADATFAITFRQLVNARAGIGDAIDACSTANAKVTLTAVSGQGPTITVISTAAKRDAQCPPGRIVGDLMMFTGSGASRTSDQIRRIEFLATRGTTDNA